MGTSKGRSTNRVLELWLEILEKASLEFKRMRKDALVCGALFFVFTSMVFGAAQRSWGVDYFVNDGTVIDDVYCSAVGNDSNDGTSGAMPKRTVQAILDTYDLEPGDTVYVDTGTYNLTSEIDVGTEDGGASGSPVRFVGSTDQAGTTINGSNHIAFRIDSAGYVDIEGFRIKNAGRGLHIEKTTVHVNGCEVYDCTIGVYANLNGNSLTIQNCVVRCCTDDGLNLRDIANSVIDLTNNTIALNSGNQLTYYIDDTSYLSGRNNIFWATENETYCLHGYNRDLNPGPGIWDYNDLYASGGAKVAYDSSPREGMATLRDWQTASGWDVNSLTNEPQFVDVDGPNNIPGDDDDDFHLRSTAGSWRSTGYVGDGASSPCIDLGQPGASVGSEPSPNGGRINMGAYGGTSQASKSPSVRRLVLLTPNGRETVTGTGYLVWLSAGPWNSSDTVSVEVSTDGGMTWDSVSGLQQTAYDQAGVTWDSTAFASSARARLRITCDQETSVTDSSDANFTIHNTGLSYYLNDGSVLHDVYCTAVGGDSNDGASPSAPKRTLANLLFAVNLEPGDTVYIDSGLYSFPDYIRIENGDSGAPGLPVTFLGSTEPAGTVFVTDNYNMLYVYAQYLLLQRLNMKGSAGHSGTTVTVNSSAVGFHIRDCRVYNTGTALNLSASGQLVENCLFTNTGNGVRCTGSASIINNTFVNGSVWLNNAQSVVLRNNVFVMSKSSGRCLYYQTFPNTADFDYNNYYVTNGADIADDWGAQSQITTLKDWQDYVGQDYHSISIDPLFVDPDGGNNIADDEDDNYHLKSAAGSWRSTGFINDAGTSPSIDAGDPNDAYGNEPTPNGSRRNQGAYGNTAQASKTPVIRILTLSSPTVGSVVSGQVSISWIGTGSGWQPGDTVTLEYSLDGGATWSTVAGASALPYDQETFRWDTTGLDSSAQTLVRVTSDADTAVSDATDTTFILHNDVLAYYVNDSSQVDDVYCQAPGNDAHSGTAPSQPKETLQALLDAYDLEPGDTVYVDTGLYALQNTVTVQGDDSGADGSPVSIVGASKPGSTDFVSLGANYLLTINSNSDYVCLKNLNLHGGNTGIYVASNTGCRLLKCRIYDNNSYGLRLDASQDTLVEHCLFHHNGNVGLYAENTNSIVLLNNTIALNDGNQLTLYNCSETMLANNIFHQNASSSTEACVYVYSSEPIASDYNNFFTADGNALIRYNSTRYNSLADWQNATFLDQNSLSFDPLIVDPDGTDNIPGNNDDNFHLKSEGGSWRPSGYVYDDVTSPSIDAGAPGDAVGEEPSPNGGRINQGAFGGQDSASKTPSTVSMPVILTDGGNGAGKDFATANTSLLLEGSCNVNTASILVNGSSTGVQYTSGSGAWSYTTTISAGANAFEVQATDSQGITTPPATITVTLDQTAPRLDSAVAISPTRVRVVFSEPMESNGALVSPSSYGFSGGGAALYPQSVARISDTQVEIIVNTMSGGALYTVAVSSTDVRDLAGIAVDPAARSQDFAGVSASLSPPVIITDGGNGAGADYTTASADLTLEGTCDPDSDAIWVNGSASGVQYTSGASSWTYTTTLVEGQNDFTVVSRDAAQNQSPADTIAITYSMAASQTVVLLDVKKNVLSLGDPIEVFGSLGVIPTRDCADLAGKQIRVRFELNGASEPDVFATVGTSCGFATQFTPTEPGEWNVFAKYDGDGDVLESQWTAPVKVIVQQSAGHAILVTGSIASHSGLPDHRVTVDRVYDALLKTGFTSDSIMVFDPDFTKDAGGIHQGLSKAGIQNAIETWASTQERSAPAPLVVVLVNHGSPGGVFHIFNSSDSSQNEITPDDLDAWLDAYAAHLGSDAEGDLARQQPVLLVVGSCYSGAFLPALGQVPGELPRRIIVSSADAAEESFKGPIETIENGVPVRDGELFVSRLFSNLSDGRNLKLAFNDASRLMRVYTRNRNGNGGRSARIYTGSGAQHALLDDSGDGTGTNVLLANPPEGEDGYLAASFHLGFGPTGNATALTFMSTSGPVLLSQGGQEAPTLGATLDQPVPALVWCTVKPPDFAIEQNEQSEQKTLDALVKINPDIAKSLQDYQWSPGQFDAVDFSRPGRYEVLFFARDDQGQLATPAQTYVYRPSPQPNSPPDAFDLIEPEDGGTIPQTAVFTWHSASDPDGDPVTYSLELVPVDWPGSSQQAPVPTIRIDGLTSSLYVFQDPGEFTGPEDLVDGITYQWSVIAYDEYGNGTSSLSTREVLVNAETNADFLPGTAIITVRDMLTDGSIDNAAIAVDGSEGMAVPSGQGQYVVPSLPPNNNYYFSVTDAPGYTGLPKGVPLQVAGGAIATATIELAPDGLPPAIQVSDPAVTFEATGGNQAVQVTNSGAGTLLWSAQITAGSDWLSVATSKVAGPGTLEITCSGNDVSSARDGTIRLTNLLISDDAVDIGVEQAAAMPHNRVDLNEDGDVNAVDVQLVINAVLGLPIQNGVNADVNTDGTLNAVDVQLVINGALGIR